MSNQRLTTVATILMLTVKIIKLLYKRLLITHLHLLSVFPEYLPCFTAVVLPTHAPLGPKVSNDNCLQEEEVGELGSESASSCLLYQEEYHASSGFLPLPHSKVSMAFVLFNSSTCCTLIITNSQPHIIF